MKIRDHRVFAAKPQRDAKHNAGRGRHDGAGNARGFNAAILRQGQQLRAHGYNKRTNRCNWSRHRPGKGQQDGLRSCGRTAVKMDRQ